MQLICTFRVVSGLLSQFSLSYNFISSGSNFPDGYFQVLYVLFFIYGVFVVCHRSG